MYNPDSMKVEKRAEFLSWYEENREKPFNTKQQLIDYCDNDVKILQKACCLFRKMFMEMSVTDENQKGLDPFLEATTVASSCSLLLRTKFLEEDKIGLIPSNGYRPEDKHSAIAMKWIKWYQKENDIERIDHALNGGEHTVGPYKVDGHYIDPNTGDHVVMDFHGDFFHGNPEVYDADVMNPVRKMKMGDVYQETIARRQYIEDRGYKVIEMWEKTFRDQLAANPEMKETVDGFKIMDRLNPRDSFMGGRTNATVLYYKCKDGEEIHYVDFCSLYPAVNKQCQYPVGE